MLMELVEPQRRQYGQWKRNVRKRAATVDEEDRKKKWTKQYVPEEEQYRKIGSSEIYQDSSTEATYDWGTVMSPAVLSSHHEDKRLKSLKVLAAMKIAENEQYLTPSILRSSSWQVWKLVWMYISSWRRDSFLMFEMFASVFAKEPQFQCHPNVVNQILPKKNVILKTTPPASTRHRIERFFSNIRISTFVHSLNACQFENLVILEICKPLSHDDLIQLTNMSKLTALKVGRLSSVPDPIISRWCSSINAGKWQNLQVLSLPIVSEDSFIKLQQSADHGKLLYLEMQSKTIINVKRDWTKVDYQNWDMVSEPILERMSWGLKAQTIMRKYRLEGRSLTLPVGTVWLDFNVVNHTFIDKFKDRESEYEQIWKLGDLVGYTQAMVLKKITKAQQGKKQSVAVEPARKKIIARSKLKVRSISSFFAL